MDRYIQQGRKKCRMFKKFETIDLIPYSVALLMLVLEVYILLQFLHLYDRLQY